MQHQIIDILANEITKRYNEKAKEMENNPTLDDDTKERIRKEIYNEIIEHMIDELQNDQTTLYD